MLALPNDQEEIRMSEAENKMLISRMLAGEVDWLEQWASDAVWMIPGSTKWSGTYSGKTNIARNLLGPLTAELKSLGKFEIDNVVAEGNYVVVQGHVTGRVTRTGQQYNNTYCLVYEIVAGKIRKHTEYCDTELITKAFGT
jgi:ketosteroid isomerase-like protein